MSTKDTVERWLSDNDTWIGLFENHDLGHPDVGRRCAFPFASSYYDQAEVGKTRAPDSKHIGIGWRYILVAKTKSVDEVVKFIDGDAT